MAVIDNPTTKAQYNYTTTDAAGGFGASVGISNNYVIANYYSIVDNLKRCGVVVSDFSGKLYPIIKSIGTVRQYSTVACSDDYFVVATPDTLAAGASTKGYLSTYKIQ
jgi:hypothetical protein